MPNHDFLVLDDEPSARTNTVRICNPVGFDPKKHLPEYLHMHADSVRHFVHTIHHNRFMYRRRDDEFIEIKAAYMRPFFTPKDDYKLVVEALKTSGVLECDGQYIEGCKCLGYRLGPALGDAEFISVTISDPNLVRKIVARREQQSQAVTWDVHRHLRQFVERVDFDHKAAADFISRNGYKDQQVALNGFKYREFFFVPCQFGRVHTNITSLKSELRRFLSFQGEKLVNLDIRNSQPLLFSVILTNFLLHEGSLDGLYNWKMDESGVYYHLGAFSSLFQEEKRGEGIIPVLHAPLRCPGLITGPHERERQDRMTRRLLALGLPEDVVRYIDLVQRGEFYEYLMSEGDIPAHKRKEFKSSFFGGVFFCKNRPVTRQAELFRRLFPNVYDVVCEIKRKDHSHLAHILQRVESSLIINRDARRCMEDFPETFIATIHDSILTTPKAAGSIRAIMMQEFAGVGLAPTIRIEDLGASPERVAGTPLRPVEARS
jgi:hypothetical protein